MKYRSVQYGVIIISVFCLLILIVTMLFYYRVQQKQSKDIKDLTFAQRKVMIGSVLNIKRQQYEAVIHENSAWDDFKERILKNDLEEDWLFDNIGSMVESYSGANIAVFDVNGANLYNCTSDDYQKIDFYKDIKVSQLLKNASKNVFFNYRGDKLFEYFCEGVVSSDDINTRQETPVGFLIMAREINLDLLDEYAEILGGVDVEVVRTENALELKQIENQANFFFSVNLVNQFGHPISYMCFVAENEVETIFEKTIPVLAIIAFVVLITFVVLVVYMRQNVIKPLLTMVKIFDKDDTNSLKKLKRNKTEFGMLAVYIEKFFSQRQELQSLNSEMLAKQDQLVQQNDVLTKQKYEIENQIENIKVLNTQIMERNKETERKNVKIFVQNEQLKQQALAIKVSQENLEKLKYELSFNSKQLEDINGIMFNCKNYALRLKNVLMVTSTPARHVFQDFFVYQHFIEKVGGDFVFAKRVDKWIISAVGDCNLRGVPGSLLSALDIFFLNEIVDLSKAAQMRPDLMLNSLNKKIIGVTGSELQSDLDRDGLHISLFMYNTETYRGYFAASKRTMIMVRDGEINEYFGDNLSVGKILDDKQFRCVEFSVLPNDLIYMYSDGCTEIVGGSFGKKLTHTNFKKEILRQHVFPLNVQKTGFKKFFEDWIGYSDQSEDISLLAFKI